MYIWCLMFVVIPLFYAADDNEGEMGKNADAQGVTGERRLQESSN